VGTASAMGSVCGFNAAGTASGVCAITAMGASRLAFFVRAL
jgi:hypothetical protein